MVPKGLDEKLLRSMQRRHVKQFGHTAHNLAESRMSILAGQELESEIPGILVWNGNMKKYLVVPAAKDLERRGLVEFHTNNETFWLTADGFSRASRGRLRRSLDFFNQNAGLATVVALLSLILSVIALVVSIRAHAP